MKIHYVSNQRPNYAATRLLPVATRVFPLRAERLPINSTPLLFLGNVEITIFLVLVVQTNPNSELSELN
jgi:hypothetical protein